MQVHTVTATAVTNYSLQVNAPAASGVSVRAFTDQSSYDRRIPIHLEAVVQAPAAGQKDGSPLMGAQVTATASLNGQNVGSLTLLDDGQTASGDRKRNDGIYSVLYVPHSGAGSYEFAVTVNNQAGQVAPPDEKWDGFPVLERPWRIPLYPQNFCDRQRIKGCGRCASVCAFVERWQAQPTGCG